MIAGSQTCFHGYVGSVERCNGAKRLVLATQARRDWGSFLDRAAFLTRYMPIALSSLQKSVRVSLSGKPFSGSRSCFTCAKRASNDGAGNSHGTDIPVCQVHFIATLAEFKYWLTFPDIVSGEAEGEHGSR